MELRRPVDVIISRIEGKMKEAQYYYRDSVSEEDWQLWKGAWKAYIESYIIAVEVLAEIIEKEEE